MTDIRELAYLAFATAYSIAAILAPSRSATIVLAVCAVFWFVAWFFYADWRKPR